ncbi:DUF4190 domain-containing protein [Streptacidiphilus anmyonensis]|uniref:DUF4190 domain-containing protein n=1 Tax=Streptacidiphilus anmyonensis TaxID=405782 RepID=UPI000A052193|nr:DUF4190 domain-containing protein [Streptacidiphilus anmyonensis]
MDQTPTPFTEAYPEAARRPVSVMAVASFASSLFGALGAVVGAVLGVLALRRIDRQGLRGRAFAWTGLTVSALWLALLVGLVVVYHSASGTVVSGHL